MFTGIVEGKGRLCSRKSAGRGVVFELESEFPLTDPKEGESIAVNGVCLTAYNIRGNRFFADVSPESLSRTTLGDVGVGESVNMERALRLADRLGGHLVSGHVDCFATVQERRPLGDFTLFTFSVPAELSRYIIEKGSITIDGVSLTVNSCTATSFSVSIIPHTLQTTTLGGLYKASKVNIEVDVIGKYVEKMLSVKKDGSGDSDTPTLNPGFLAEHGFL